MDVDESCFTGFIFFKQKTAYEIQVSLEFRRVLFRSGSAGGSWWHRVWRSRNAKRNLICTFCERPESQVARLIAGPDVFICDRCVALAEQALNIDCPPARRGALAVAGEGAKTRGPFGRK